MGTGALAVCKRASSYTVIVGGGVGGECWVVFGRVELVVASVDGWVRLEAQIVSFI